jgi:hypothetical protein
VKAADVRIGDRLHTRNGAELIPAAADGDVELVRREPG